MSEKDPYVKNKLKRRKRKSVITNILVVIFLLALSFLTVKAVTSILFKNDKNEKAQVSKSETTKEKPKSTKVIDNTNTNEDTEAEKSTNETKPDPNPEVKEKPKEAVEKTVRIKAVGDILIHDLITDYAQNTAKDDKISYSKNFELIKDTLADADYTIANFESTIHPDLPLVTFPLFNVPKEIIGALKEAGVDGVTTANNHSLDSGIEGIETTINAIKEYGIVNFGTQLKETDRIKLVDAGPVKLAVLAYAESLNGLEPRIDGTKDQFKINRLNLETIKNDISQARKMGADIIITYPHWGVEYQSLPRQDQIDISRNMIEWGADVVCGNHPHVVQPAEWYTSSTGKKGFIIYSMGNFISNQCLESIGDIRTEHSVIVDMTFSNKGEKTTLKDVKVHPTWMRRRYFEGVGTLNQTMLAKDFMPGGKFASSQSKDEQDRAKQAFDMTTKTLNTKVD